MRHVFGERLRAVFFSAYLLSALASCFLVTILPGSLPYRLIKVMPMLLLCSARFREHHGRLAHYVGLGLLASFVGDVVIDSSFVGGLGAFLMGHLFYLVAMGLPSRTIGTLLSMLAALIYGGFFFWIFVGSGRAPEPLHIPVTVYMLVISTMFGRAIGRAFVDPMDRSARIFLIGAVLFVASDTLIGIKRWVFPIPHASIWILSTYYAGQWLIYQGSMSRTVR